MFSAKKEISVLESLEKINKIYIPVHILLNRAVFIFSEFNLLKDCCQTQKIIVFFKFCIATAKFYMPT